MKILDFFKNLNKRQKNAEQNTEAKDINFSELESWLEDEIKKNKEEQERVFSLIKREISELSENITSKIKAAEEVDVNSKKSKEKFKAVSDEGRKKYIEFVENLVEKLESIENEGLDKAVSKINNAFSDFHKKSRLSYERATVLIGKEMGEIRKALKSFSNKVMEIFEKNKGISETSGAILSIKLDLVDFRKKEKEKSNVNEEISKLDEETKKKEKSKEEVLGDIEEIKNSDKYSEIQQKNKEIETLKGELDKGLSDLRQKIDFKSLGNFYHIFKNKMEIVNKYKNDFKSNFYKDRGESIKELLENAKFDNVIIEKISECNKKMEKISDLEKERESEELPKKLDRLYTEKERTVHDIENLENRKTRARAKIEGIEKDKKRIFEKIKEEAKKLNINLIE